MLVSHPVHYRIIHFIYPGKIPRNGNVVNGDNLRHLQCKCKAFVLQKREAVKILLTYFCCDGFGKAVLTAFKIGFQTCEIFLDEI